MSDQSLNQFQQHVTAAFNLYHHQNKNSYEIKQFFLQNGFDESYADQVIEAMLQNEDPLAKRDHSYLIYGIIFIAIGLGLGKIFSGVIFTGLIVVGAVSIIKWLINDRWEQE